MMARLGLELGARVIRGVVVEGWGWPKPRTRVLEIAYDRDHVDDAIQALESHTAGVRRIALTVGMPFLVTKRVKLPVLSAAERRNMLLLEPERYFADRSTGIVPAVRADTDLVFATPDEPLAAWIQALERIAPIDVVEPAPVSLARALARVGIRDGSIALEGGGLVEIVGGQIVSARRVYGDTIPAGSVVIPPVDDVPPQFAAAYGAVLAIDEPRDFAETLVGPKQARTITGRRRRELVAASAACALAVVFAIASLDSWRARAADELDAGLAGLRQRAAPALALETELEAHAQRAQAIRQVEAERPTRLPVLLALSRKLPPGAFVRGIRGSGAEWQLDGYAPSASSVLTSLGSTPEFKDVHFLSAMDHAQVGQKSYESFALGFRFVPTP